MVRSINWLSGIRNRSSFTIFWYPEIFVSLQKKQEIAISCPFLSGRQGFPSCINTSNASKLLPDKKRPTGISFTSLSSVLTCFANIRFSHSLRTTFFTAQVPGVPSDCSVLFPVVVPPGKNNGPDVSYPQTLLFLACRP